MHAPVIRARICEGLSHLGVKVDPVRNDSNAAVISPQSEPVFVWVMQTDEELIIGRAMRRLVDGDNS